MFFECDVGENYCPTMQNAYMDLCAVLKSSGHNDNKYMNLMIQLVLFTCISLIWSEKIYGMPEWLCHKPINERKFKKKKTQ